MSSLVKFEKEDRVAVVSLNRPEKLNALNPAMRNELAEVIERIGNDESIGAVVLTGEGRAFCTGADIAGSDMPTDPIGVVATYKKNSDRQLCIWNLPQPVIAAVNGYALGRGMEVALWCDIVIAASEAQFGEPECRDGWFIASIIPALTTPQQAKLLMLSGERISATKAREIGLVTEVVPGADCKPAAIALAKRLAHIPTPTARLMKRYINAIADGMPLNEAMNYGNTMGALLRTHTDEQLGVSELVKIRETQGMKAYFQARDKPFNQDDAWSRLNKPR